MGVLGLLVAICLGTAPVFAAEPLPPEVAVVIEHAREAGLPTAPLEAKALEGLSKGVPPQRIAGALSRREASMAATARSLGAGLSTSDPAGHLPGGGAALTAGASETALRQVSEDVPEHRVVATRTLADLMVQGFSEPQALDLVRGASHSADPSRALSGLATTAASLVNSGLTPTAATEQLHNQQKNGKHPLGNVPPQSREDLPEPAQDAPGKGPKPK